jgi:hypothetical protein
MRPGRHGCRYSNQTDDPHDTNIPDNASDTYEEQS